MTRRNTPEDVWRVIERGGADDCWPIRTRRTQNGYGQFMVCGVRRQAHRVVYELVNGPVPTGFVVDHTCHNRATDCPGDACPHRACCNPAHLDAVPQLVNVRRSPLHKANRRTCPKGHPYDAQNTRIGSNGGRFCRTCNSVFAAETRRRRPAKSAIGSVAS